MALHPVNLPKSARYLFRVVGLQKTLLKVLADPNLNANAVNTAWVQNVWCGMDAEWVRKFCLDDQEARIWTIAQAPPVARQALYDEFCRQNKVKVMLNTGGNFQKLEELPGFTRPLVTVVKEFFNRCYKLLSHNEKRGWNGYEFNGHGCVTNRAYKDDFCSDYPARVVCPYCDGEIGTPELDHYLSKADFPLLACSPWNLVPVCRSCNDVITGKGGRLAITLGPPHSTNDWLHPFMRPASDDAQISLNGIPADSIPQLHSSDTAEQRRLDNHTGLIRSLSKRWTNVAAIYFDRLVWKVNQAAAGNHVSKRISAIGLASSQLDERMEFRGRAASSMVEAAVCRAVLNLRPGYIEEFLAPNAPALE